ncbi:MAG: hypothetical protein QM773_03090 [Hyphomonadaceae bacterium]
MTAKAAITCAAVCCLALAPFALAQTPPPAGQKTQTKPYTAPRTSFGTPSFEGVWNQNFVMLMESTPRSPALVLPEAEAKTFADMMAKGIGDSLDRGLDPEVPELMKMTDGLPIVNGQRRTRMVVLPEDGKIPYTPEARKESSRGPRNPPSTDYEVRPNWERCLTSLGLPPVTGMGTTNVNPRRIVQIPGYVVLHTEYGDEARIIPLTATHKPRSQHSPLGDSIARWDGETLVIETINLPDEDRVRFFSNLIVSSESRVIEKFTRLSDKELLYQFTVEDPKIYTAPWLAEYSLYQTSQRMFEHACHEGNYSLPHILQAQLIKETRAAQAAPPKP